MGLAGVWRRLGPHGLVLAAVAVSVLVATAVLSAVAGLAQSAATAGVRQRLAADAGRSVEVTARWAAPGLSAADRAVHSALVRTMSGTPFRTVTAQRGVSTVDLPVPPSGRRWATDTALPSLLAVLPDPGRYARLRSGSWPDAPEAAPAADGGLRVALPEAAADRLGLDSGGSTVVRTPGTGEPLRLTVTGVYREDPDAAAFWAGLGGADAGTQPLVLIDGARLAALPAFGDRMLAVWLALPDTGRSSLAELAALRDRVSAFARSDTARSVYRGAEPALADTAVRSALPGAVDGQVVPVLTARAEIAVPLGLLALLAAVVLVHVGWPTPSPASTRSGAPGARARRGCSRRRPASGRWPRCRRRSAGCCWPNRCWPPCCASSGRTAWPRATARAPGGRRASRSWCTARLCCCRSPGRRWTRGRSGRCARAARAAWVCSGPGRTWCCSRWRLSASSNSATTRAWR
ncbi:hypothetical protein ACFC6U_33845 [Kitasatospora purpeofusca]|uniref:hypothetical protein n=1 Tax=Kitasatospora purpeofusca TaxID=67352 RepID=UPI0035DB9DE6